MNLEFQIWINAQGQAVRDVARRLQLEPGHVFLIRGKPHWFTGYGEHEGGEVSVLVSPVNPSVDYERALKVQQPICAKHFDELMASIAAVRKNQNLTHPKKSNP